jgi:hypothetical protein
MTPERSERSGISIVPPVRTPKTFRQPCSIVVHVVSQTAVSGWATALKGSNVTLRSPSVVLCDSLARRSRPTLLSGSGDQRSRLAVGGEGSHALKLKRPTSGSYERLELARRVPDTADSRIQPGAPRYDAKSDRHCGEAFSPLAQPHSQLDKVPCRHPVSIHYDQPERAAVACFDSQRDLCRCGTDDLMTPTTSACSSGLELKMRHFLHWPLSQRNKRPAQKPPRPTPPIVETSKI